MLHSNKHHGFSGGSDGMVKNLLAMLRPWFHLWAGKIPWRRKWLPTPVFLPGKPTDREIWLLHSMGSQRVGHDWATNQNTYLPKIKVHLKHFFFFYLQSNSYKILLSFKCPEENQIKRNMKKIKLLITGKSLGEISTYKLFVIHLQLPKTYKVRKMNNNLISWHSN